MVLLWRSGMEQYSTLCCLYLPINSYQYRPYWLLQTESPCVTSQAVTNNTSCLFRSHINLCNAPLHTTNCTHPVCSGHQSICAMLQHTINCTLKFSTVRSISVCLYVTCTNWSNSNCSQHFVQNSSGRHKLWKVMCAVDRRARTDLNCP